MSAQLEDVADMELDIDLEMSPIVRDAIDKGYKLNGWAIALKNLNPHVPVTKILEFNHNTQRDKCQKSVYDGVKIPKTNEVQLP